MKKAEDKPLTVKQSTKEKMRSEEASRWCKNCLFIWDSMFKEWRSILAQPRTRTSEALQRRLRHDN